MNYNEALSYIEGLGKFGMNLGLDRIKRLLALMGSPEEKLKVIHVAGTNGKGSTVALISSILMSQGYNVGIYTSPHLERYTERIKINQSEILEDEVAGLVEGIKPHVERVIEEGYDHPTEFEISTACAFKYFHEKNVDFVILEVGLGGRLDATNACNPLLTVITTISYDHMNILGDTLSKIAGEKAGIIKKGVPLVLYPQEAEAEEVIKKRAEEMNAPLYDVSNMKPIIKENNIGGMVFDIEGRKDLMDLRLGLLGKHQTLNASTTLTAVDALRDLGVLISDKSLRDGLKKAKWPGRFEILQREPYILVDGCHNIQGINSFVDGLKFYFPNKKINIVCGILKDKQYMEMVKKLCSISDDFVTVTPDSPRALDALELKDIFTGLNKRAESAHSIEEAVKLGIKNTKPDEVLAFCGSLYMIGEARGWILKDK